MSSPSINPRILELLRFTRIHQRHSENLARVSGDRFNIFDILRVGHLEVTTHSPILAELLNPKGQHGQGEVFLVLFREQFKGRIEGISKLDATAATVRMEYYVGPVTETSGGRIDIVIDDRKTPKILIENKIYAGLQENQLSRYRDFDSEAHLFYLTLFPESPSYLSVSESNDIRCECISYAVEILAWLKECRKEVATISSVREMISQYISLVEHLTNQSTTERMNKDLIDEILADSETLKAFYTLRDAQSALQHRLCARLDAKLKEICAANELEKVEELVDLGSAGSSFSFRNPTLTDINVKIRFEFSAGGFNGFLFGFALDDVSRPCPVSEQLVKGFAAQFPHAKGDKIWPVWTFFEDPYRNWAAEAFESLRSDQFATILEERLKSLLKIAKHAQIVERPSDK